MNAKKKNFNYVDLFAGAGGLSEGFARCGFKSVVQIEMDKNANDTLRTRACYRYLLNNHRIKKYYDYLSKKISKNELYKLVPKNELEKCVCIEISNKNLEKIYKQIDLQRNREDIDLIIGGPPCQAYSIVGRSVKSANDRKKIEGKEKVKTDKRNYLYKFFCKFLGKYKPKIFVFENVTGMLSARDGFFLSDFKKCAQKIGYRIDETTLIASDYGVKQSRKRIIIIGYRNDLILKNCSFEKWNDNTTINQLFDDLPSLKLGKNKKNNKYKKGAISNYLANSKIRTKNDILTQHETRSVSNNDRLIYGIAIRKWNKNHERLKYNQLPKKLKKHKNEKSFLDRFKVVEGDCNVCHTMMAHISKDGHYYIHPDLKQKRSLSIREAARIQSFPDNYFFEGGMTAAFKQIGNAVPPLMSETIARSIKKILNDVK